MTTFVERFSLLISVSRVPSWCFGPILYTIGIIHSRVLPKTLPDIILSGFQIFCLSFPLCIIVFGVNDVYDYTSDVHNPRKHEQSLEGGILSPIHHSLVLSAARVSTALISLSFIVPLFASPLKRSSFYNLQGPMCSSIILFLSWQYSSPPLRLKELPILDSISNGMIVWLAWALGYVASGNPLFGVGANESANKGWLLAFCTAGVHALGAAADVEADIAAGQRTIATMLGKRLAAGFSAACYLLASTTVEPTSFVGIYSFIGTAISLVPVFNPAWAHQTFRAVVYVSILGATGWIGERALAMLKREKVQ